MINSILVGATIKSLEDILNGRGVPFEFEDSEAYRAYRDIWDRSTKKDLALRQARPAVERIASKEPYIFLKSGDPLFIRFNDQNRELERDSFGEILLERKDLDWRVSISVKVDAKIIATMPVAGREMALYMNKVDNVFNEIDDFGQRIFGIPCSNRYFEDMNEILLRMAPHDMEKWRDFITDKKFIYGSIIKPMLRAIGDEIPRICKDHPEAPQRLIDYFYGTIDYYYINPIDKVEATRIGAVNSHRCLGRIPDNDNLKTPSVKFPTKLLDVRFANGRYGELSNDTIQISFDGGWSVCIMLQPVKDRTKGHRFELKVYLPVTPFGSYRDQVDWDPEN